jgi:hypothetical protein
MLQNNAHVHKTITGESDKRGNAQDVKKLDFLILQYFNKLPPRTGSRIGGSVIAKVW